MFVNNIAVLPKVLSLIVPLVPTTRLAIILADSGVHGEMNCSLLIADYCRVWLCKIADGKMLARLLAASSALDIQIARVTYLLQASVECSIRARVRRPQ
jgi:hypothetical protein